MLQLIIHLPTSSRQIILPEKNVILSFPTDVLQNPLRTILLRNNIPNTGVLSPSLNQRWRWPLATSPNAKIFPMWRKICDVFSHSGEDKNEMLTQ